MHVKNFADTLDSLMPVAPMINHCRLATFDKRGNRGIRVVKKGTPNSSPPETCGPVGQSDGGGESEPEWGGERGMGH